jgi:hypothetical protein
MEKDILNHDSIIEFEELEPKIAPDDAEFIVGL